jgi:ankyrin repeat protein
MTAVSNDQLEKVGFLANKGVSLETKNFSGLNVHKAVRKNSVEAVQILLNAEAATETQRPNGYSISHSPSLINDGQILTTLFSRSNKFNIEARTSSWRTPLLLALSRSRLRAAAKLVSLGADVNAVDNKGFNILHYAAMQTDTSILDFVLGLENISNLEALTSEGATPVLFAASQGRFYTFY